MTPSPVGSVTSANQRGIVFHTEDWSSILIIVKELANLRIVYWCGDRSRLRGTIHCCSTLINDLIKGITGGRNVTHESNNEGVCD